MMKSYTNFVSELYNFRIERYFQRLCVSVRVWGHNAAKLKHIFSDSPSNFTSSVVKHLVGGGAG